MAGRGEERRSRDVGAIDVHWMNMDGRDVK
jgi:hypothetical protein